MKKIFFSLLIPLGISLSFIPVIVWCYPGSDSSWDKFQKTYLALSLAVSVFTLWPTLRRMFQWGLPSSPQKPPTKPV